MRAAVYHGRRDVRVEEVPDPPGPSAGEVLVAPILCGICGTDVHEFTHGPIVTPVEPHALTGATNPQILGHEFCAEVLEVGEGVTHVLPGQRVSAMPLLFCGTCPYCRLGHNHLCERMGCTGLSYAWGGLAEAAIVQASQLSVLPDEIDNTQGALIEPIAVAAYGVDRAGVAPGTSVLVTGGGPIGILSAEYAIARGATTVVLSEPNPRRRAVAESLGLTAVLDPTAVDVVAEVQELTGGLGVDASIECAGAGPALDACIRATRSRGTVAQTGLHVAPATIDAFELSLREITLVGTWCYPVTDFPRIIALLASGKMRGSAAVTATVGIEETVDGFERLIDPTGGDVKILIDPKSI
ncbi:MAG: 2,3-butanediol dehydrogenase [Acidimicrobiia bacterium]|nr:2,3-butanediol dehydrogenase [Acidimicrobiia bacterium]